MPILDSRMNVNEFGDFADRTQLGLDPFERRALNEPLSVEDPERLAQTVDRRRREARAAHPDQVETGDAVLTLLENERGNVLGRRAHSAEHGQPADPHPLLNRRMPREDATVVKDRHGPPPSALFTTVQSLPTWTSWPRWLPIMNMLRSPMQRHPATVERPAMDGHEFTEYVAVADPQRR